MATERDGWFSEDDAWEKRFGERYVDHGVVDDGLDQARLEELEREFDEHTDDDAERSDFGSLEELPEK